ncbi:hypothetical protein FQA39_LY02690 [Lamprigera yunnana]|nr:hypothetical protein FQA39_LY02690 [Lamprigera yunnana]
MAQDVFSKMAEDPFLLKEDGYLNAATEIKKIIYHPSLNVILICINSGIVRVLDVNSGVVLQASYLSSQNANDITCRYIPGQDRVLFCDGYSIGVRSDYNGVLLLDTILQKPVNSSKDNVKLELLLSEAIILKQSLANVSILGVDHVFNELTEKILEAQKQAKKGIKAQKWNTVCLDLPLDLLRSSVNCTVTDLIGKKQHCPELGVASAVYERLSELIGEQANASDQRAMASEAKRRETFTHWPHMDYKWALPDQMAQAGFYHQPNASGDDRVMCFTCTVCLVCWERTDEPWSEHERHSPTCPFVMAEYTQNVPLSLTYATNPAVDATYRGLSVKTLGTSAVPHLIATANRDGLISVFDVSGKLKRTHSFFVTQFDSHILEKLTQDFGVPGTWSDSDEVKYPAEREITALTVVGEKSQGKITTGNSTTLSDNGIRPTIICGLNIRCSSTKNLQHPSSFVEALNDQNKNEQSSINIMEVDEILPVTEVSCLYLVIYDFQYTKEPETETETVFETTELGNKRQDVTVLDLDCKDYILTNDTDGTVNDTNMDVASSYSDDLVFLSDPKIKVYNLLKKQMSMYQNLIPGESDEIFLPPSNPPTKQHSTRRYVVHDITDSDTSQATSLIHPPDYSFKNGQISSSPNDNSISNERSISDHITELKNSKLVKKLNYSRAEQCISLPQQYKNRRDLEISDIIPTQDGNHILVVLKSPLETYNSVLLIYSLNFMCKMVKVDEEPILVRELSDFEKPIELTLLPQLERLNGITELNCEKRNCEGTAVLVCSDGIVRIIDLSTLRTISIARLEGTKFVSAVYCNSLERLCASTEAGSLHFYALNDTDNDSVEDQEEEDLFSTPVEVQNSNLQSSDISDVSDTCGYFYEPENIINLSELKRLQMLCTFDPLKAGYCAVVPPCWSEMQQAQRQRRHTHLQINSEQHTKMFRLQTDTTTWDEHVFELTLSSPTCIGHVDVHFSLHSSSSMPHVEITLLKQNTNSIGHKRDFKFAVDDSVTYETLQWAGNPVTSHEYLQAHNVDILAGPVDIVSCLDLTEQSGCVTLTSPKLFKTRIRTLLLHIKSVCTKENGKAKFSSSFKSKRENRTSGITSDKHSQSGSLHKIEFYMGCDCLHEVSVTIHSAKHTDIPHERNQRSSMLESNVFVQSLCLTAMSQSTIEQQSVSLDLLIWIASIRLARNRSNNGQAPNQQIEFLKIIESNLNGLLYHCLLFANRSLGHKCVKFMIICSNGAKDFGDQVEKGFDSSILNVLMTILESIDNVNSAASLQWLINLLLKVTKNEQMVSVASKCISLLENVSTKLSKRTNPYHLLLRSRYGLFGTPLEPELFDVEPPPPIKASSITVTYATVVAGETITPQVDFHTNYAFNKETLDPKEVLSVSKGDGKIKLKNIAPSKLVRGLLETEHLHFTCVSASEGTRIERADINGSSFINNIIPITVSGPQTQTSGTKKVDGEQYVTEIPEVVYHNNVAKISGNGQSSINNSYTSLIDGAYQVIFQTDNVKTEDFSKLISDTLEISVDSDSSSMTSEPQSKSAFTADQIMSPNQSLPWQQLLVSPPQQVIVVERMHSGARRFVILDFGQPVLLTDVLIPACHDLVSISLDLWIKGEDIDATRLVIATDIGSRNLVLNDLQPSPLCRYMKITAVGRYGMSTTRCRIPVGYFYGHLIVLPEEVPVDQIQSSTAVTPDMENQLNVLSMLLEDVNCRYSLACSKLKDLLHPFLTSGITNASHLSAYMNIMKDSVANTTNAENSKVFAAYQEAITYQRQLNTVRNVMCRVESGVSNAEVLATASVPEACIDKLRCIVESLLDALLSLDVTTNINLESCHNLFQGLCVSQCSRIQFLAATALLRSCGKQKYWGSFLAETLKEMYSSSYTCKFPQDRVFVLLAFLGRKSLDRSAVLDATLKVIAEVLLPLAQNRKSLLAVTIDLPLLGWLLLFLSLQLDMSKVSLQNATRWDWVTGEMAGKVTENVASSYKKKLQKRVLQYKQQLENLDWSHKVVQSSTQALSALSTHAANLTSKLEATLKQQEHIFKKMKHFKSISKDIKNSNLIEFCDVSKQGKRRREPAESQNSKPSFSMPPQYLDMVHCLAVAKGLRALLLAMDHSCSADMFLLSCKIIGRLVCISKLQLGQLMNEDQLLRLIHICIGSELPWAPHALACLLQDIVEVGKRPNSEMEMETEPCPASTSWGAKDLLTDLEILCDSFALEDNVVSEPATKQGKTSNNNNNNNQLPSVFESDDSELDDFLDDILERGKTHSKKSSKNVYMTSASSCAMDSRLEMGVEASAEMTLRRIISQNLYNLMQNVNATTPYVETEQEFPAWSPELISPWNVEAQATSQNRIMLVSCFNSLFKELQLQSSINIEHILQLWLTLNCVHGDHKFDPSTSPFIVLDQDAISSLITTIAWSSGLSLRTWCSALQTLTMVCNMMQQGSNTATASQWMDSFVPTLCIINHSDFVQLLLRLLSGTGLVFSEKGLAGPSLCKALHDLLVRLQMRCDVVSPSSKSGSQLKSLLLRVVYQLVQPTGPLAAKQGPLDAQCKLLQSMSYLDFCNADISIAISIFECTGILVHSYTSQVDRIKCVNIGECLQPPSHLFNGIFASVLGSETNKQDRPVSWDVLLVSLLKLLAKLVQTPLPSTNEQAEPMEVKPCRAAQTDESKAEQIQQERVSLPVVPCLADTVLQHHPSIIRLCQSLAACKASSLSMLANISQQNTFADWGEPGTIGDAVFHTLAALVRKTSRKELVMEPLLIFLSQAPQLSEPLLWFILQILDTKESLQEFLNKGGVTILGKSLVHSSNAPNTVSHAGTVSMVMQHFGGSTTRSDASTAIASASASKKLQQASLENTMALINFAPFGTIKCQSSTAQPADVLIQGSAATHRRARTAQWSYHFYPEEVHTELTLQLPSAVLLREVHLQPHLSSLATCPSAVALEVSSDGPSRLVPACPPLPTSGMTFIRLHLPVPEVVNCIQLRLYKPRDANNIGLSQIRLLGTSAFGGGIKQQVLDLTEDESHCKYSLGWLRLLHHCFMYPRDSILETQIIDNAAQVPDLLLVCCGLLLVPSHIPGLYLPNLEKVLCKLSLHNRQNGLRVIEMLLESRPSVGEPFEYSMGVRKPLSLQSAGIQSACELLYEICEHEDSDTEHRIIMLLQWLKTTSHNVIITKNTDLCNPAYISCIASILWTANQLHILYNLSAIIDTNLFHTIYTLSTIANNNFALKHALDCLLCSLCYIKIELFSSLLQLMGVLVPNLSTDHDASISDDRKDSESMTDDSKQTFENESEWYGRLVIGDLHELELSEENLETIALVSRSPNAIQHLLDSGLPKKLTNAILEFCSTNSDTSVYPLAKLKNVTAILKFFADVCDEKVMRDWLGSKDGSLFWLPLLRWLCKRPLTKRSNLKSEVHTQLEEICVRFLSKCCLCHTNNQALLAKILCDVISQQRNGISGFMRRLILQLLLENEKVPVSINADEMIYKNTAISYYLPLHPAFKETHNQALLYLGTNTLLADIIEQHILFSTAAGIDSLSANKKDINIKNESMKSWWGMTIDSDLSVAAGVTAKDKRAKDAKNAATSTPLLKKKRYAATEATTTTDIIEGRIIKCAAISEQPLPVTLSLGQVLRLIENKEMKTDWPCIHLVISKCKGFGSDDKNAKIEMNPIIHQRSFSSALQVFSSVGGLALLAQHLPAVYPETIRTSSNEKSSSEQSESDWVKVEGSDEIYEDIIEDTPGTSTPSKASGIITNVPTHSLTAFGLFLRLPGYAEMLLKDMKKASCLLRLVLGVTDDGEGGDIFQSPLADSLPTLPFEVLRQLYDYTPLSTDDGRLLRRISINTGVVHLILACLGIFTHQTQSGIEKENKDKDSKIKDERTQLYWAKGTGFGTGSTQQSWNVEQALLKQRSEEEHVTVLLQVLASYINPKGEAADELRDNVLPPIFHQLLANSALLPALSSYLRNDSVLDMARHIPLYRAALQLLRALAVSSQLVSLLLPQKVENNGPSVGSLLKNMKTCVDTYASKLKFGNKPANIMYLPKLGDQFEELERDEGLAQLMPDIQATANLVKEVTDRLEDSDQDMLRDARMDYPLSASIEERYLSFMKHLQFDTYEMIQELPEGGYKFVISHHFESNARTAGDQSHPARVKRLAQEAVTLATSLPLSYSSSVFVRCDTDRLDMMKVLITGPAETPYANGCFELDVYFPPDYPLAPMLINLETTGHHTVRFNPNLYNDGKVCLSVLNTWHGRPEEKWNPQTSSFLQVLVSIQSLILVPEPYFNEPGYERSRGTPAGNQSSREYNQNIWQATVRWAMLEQVINPCPCFKDVIHAHFYLKRHEIINQIDNWIKDVESHFAEKRLSRNSNKRSTFYTNVETFKKVFNQLKEKLMQLKPPEGLDHTDLPTTSRSKDADECNTLTDGSRSTTSRSTQHEIDIDVDMEKMVDDMCE